MTEINCDNYMTKLNQIIIACNNAFTSKNDLETLIDELNILSNTIDSDISLMSIPSTMSHFHKFMLVLNVRTNNRDLQCALYNLINVRIQDLKTQAGGEVENPTPLNTIEERITYAQETENIKTYIKSIINGCSCMSGRCNIINFPYKN